MSNLTNAGVGARIKEIRNQQNITLKQLSESTGLSIGFISQLERGLSSIAIETLNKLAKALNVAPKEILDVTSFDLEDNAPVLRSFERKTTLINPTNTTSVLSNNCHQISFLPREYHLQPFLDEDEIQTYSHEGYEWLYILEGILTVVIENNRYDLYPGDTITIDSSKLHNWQNRGSKTVKFIAINTPNPFKK